MTLCHIHSTLDPPAHPQTHTFQLLQQQLDVALVSLVLLRPPSVSIQDDAPRGQLQLLQRHLSLADLKFQLLAAQTQTVLCLTEPNHLEGREKRIRRRENCSRGFLNTPHRSISLAFS